MGRTQYLVQGLFAGAMWSEDQVGFGEDVCVYRVVMGSSAISACGYGRILVLGWSTFDG